MTEKSGFTIWLEEKLRERAWKPADLAREARIDTGLLSRILNSDREAGVDYCIAIADALKVSREEVFRVRGWLRSAPDPVSTKRLTELFTLMEGAKQETLLEVAAALANQPGERENETVEELPSHLIEELSAIIERAEASGSAEAFTTAQVVLNMYQRSHPRFYQRLVDTGIVARAFPTPQNDTPSAPDPRPSHNH